MLRMIREVEPRKPSTKLSSSAELPSIAANRKLEPARLTRQVHGDLDWIAMKCLAKERNRRYETANGLAMDIQRYLADEPVLAGPPSVGYRLRKFVRRNRGRVVAASLLLCALIAGVVGTAVGLVRARQAEQKANERLADSIASQKKAVARFRLAREAVDGFQTRVSESPDLKAHSLEGLRTRLLESASGFYEKFVQEQDDDPEIRAELGRAYSRLGKVYGETARFRDSVKAFRSAIAIQEQLSESFPREAHYRRDLGKSLNDLAEAYYETGAAPPGEPVKVAQRALLIRQALAAADPANPQYQFDLAETCSNLGGYGGAQSKEEREELRNKALEIARALASAHPEVAEFRNMLGNVCNNCAWYADSHVAALPLQEESVGVFEKLVADHPENADYLDSLANALHNLGKWNMDLGRAAPAEGYYKNAQSIRKKLAASHPLVSGYLSKLAVTDARLGALYFEAGRHSEAEPPWQEAVGLFDRLSESASEQPTKWEAYRICHEGLANLYRLTGRTDVAGAIWKKYVAVCQERVVANPKNAAARQALGNALRAQGDLHEAIASYRTSIALDATNIQTRWGLGSTFIALGEKSLQHGNVAGMADNYQKNFEIWKEYFTANPDSAEARTGLAAAHRWLTFYRLAAGDAKAAAEESRKAVDARPDDIENWNVHVPTLSLAGDSEKCLQVCAELLERFGETEDAEMAYRVSRICSLAPAPASGTTRVVQLARRAVSAKRHPWYLHALGLALYRAGELDAAITVLNESLALGPGWEGRFDNWLVLSLAHQGRGGSEESLKWLEKANRWIDQNTPIRTRDYLGQLNGIYPHDWLEGWGLHREAEAQLDKEIAALRKAIGTNPEDFSASWRLANTLRQKRFSGTAAAVAFQRLAELRPDDVGLWYLAAQAHLTAGDRDGYRRICGEMLKRFGKTSDPEVADRMLYAFLPEAGAVEDAAALLPLGELAGTREKNARVLGGALYRAGNYEAAIPRLEEGQGRAWDHLFLAMAHHRLGRAERARDYLQRASRQIANEGYPWPENVEAEHLLSEAQALMK
jgi:tetratricopeptide (TPR) repeat protein